MFPCTNFDKCQVGSKFGLTTDSNIVSSSLEQHISHWCDMFHFLCVHVYISIRILRSWRLVVVWWWVTWTRRLCKDICAWVLWWKNRACPMLIYHKKNVFVITMKGSKVVFIYFVHIMGISNYLTTSLNGMHVSLNALLSYYPLTNTKSIKRCFIDLLCYVFNHLFYFYTWTDGH